MAVDELQMKYSLVVQHIQAPGLPDQGSRTHPGPFSRTMEQEMQTSPEQTSPAR
jgi:hypothetical protein